MTDALRDDQRRAEALRSTGEPDPLARTYSGEDAWDVYLGLCRRGLPVLDPVGDDVAHTIDRVLFADHVLVVTGEGVGRFGRLLPARVAALIYERDKAKAALLDVIAVLRRFPTAADELLGPEVWARVCAITGEGDEEDGE